MKIKKLSYFILLLAVLWGFVMSEAAQGTPPCGKTSPKKGAGNTSLVSAETIRALGVGWGYDWYINEAGFKQDNYEHVPMVRPMYDHFYKPTPKRYLQRIAGTYPGRYWLVFNEPDVHNQDGLSQAEAAAYYHWFRNIIKEVDPTAKIIVGGVAWADPTWMTGFREEYKKKYGAYPVVEGWHAHWYSDPGTYNSFDWRRNINFWKDWMIQNGGKVSSDGRIVTPDGKHTIEFWLTELGALTSDGTGQQIMREQIPWLESLPWLTRYAWFNAYIEPDQGYKGTLTLPGGQLSVLGQIYSTFGNPFTFKIQATAGSGGTVNPSGNVKVVPGSSKTFNITSTTGYSIVDVKVDGVSVGPLTSQTFANVTSNHTLEAVFASSNGFTLSTSKTGMGNGIVTSNPAGPVYSAGTVVTLTATPDTNSLFAGWSGGCTGISATCQVTMSADASVTATFNLRPNTYTITATAGANGSISPQGAVSVNAGESKTFSVTPSPGYMIADVKVDGVSQGQSNTYTFTNITSNHILQATFSAVSPNQYTLTVFKTGTGLGSISQNPTGSVFNAGTVVTITAVPGAKSAFEGWSGACIGTNSTCELTMSTHRVVTAKFKESSSAADGQGIFDMNGDGKADILWQHQGRGEVYVWYMEGATFTRDQHIATISDDLNWKIAGVGDFNGDGKPDILWHHRQRGEVYVWFMDGATFVRDQHIRTIIDDLNWKIAGVGDFNGDGKPDILWHHQQRGEVYVWFMDGAKFLYDKYIRTVPEIEWQIEAVGDYNGDGKPDILWRNQKTGEVYIWFMDGATFVRDQLIRVVEDTDWKIVN